MELVVSMGGPEGTIAFRGHDGIAEWAREMGDVWRDIRFEPLEVESDPAGRRALVVVRVSTRGRASDLGLEGMEAHVVTIGPDGKVTRLQGFTDLDQARAAFRARSRVYDEPRARIAQWIERCPPEAEVAGSNPAARV